MHIFHSCIKYIQTNIAVKTLYIKFKKFVPSIMVLCNHKLIINLYYLVLLVYLTERIEVPCGFLSNDFSSYTFIYFPYIYMNV